MKKCTKCKVEKPLTEFHKDKNRKDGFMSGCKSCKLIYSSKHRDKINLYAKKYYKENREEHLKRNKEWYWGNKEYKMEYQKKYKKQRRSTDIKYKIKVNTISRISKAIKKYSLTKKSSSIKELGCAIKEYFAYLEQQFTDNMSWDNYGTYWEIDHIYPLSKGGSFHYTNTQPLTIEENRRKSNRL